MEMVCYNKASGRADRQKGANTMKCKVSIPERLKDLRVERHLSLEELEAAVDISKSALGSYESDKEKEINHGNLLKLADFYHVSADYLLCLTDNRNPENTAFTDLHINDDMAELLKSGRINNRLLCELAIHKDFIKLLADIEIYVDRIASMQVESLNAYVDTVRHEILKRYRPGEADPYLRILSAAHIDEDEYFSQLVSDDLIRLVRDIRAAHKKDSETAPDKSVAETLKEDIEEVMNFKGSDKERQAILYCKRLGIRYNKLTEQEFWQLIHILEKSSLLKSSGSKRRK